MLNTPGILILAIKAGLLTIEEADNAKTILEHHRFTMNHLFPGRSFLKNSISSTPNIAVLEEIVVLLAD
jgi:hypothetical protein